MFTPIEQLPNEGQQQVLSSLDAPAEGEDICDIGVTDPGGPG
jgi:hypothetical protein